MIVRTYQSKKILVYKQFVVCVGTIVRPLAVEIRIQSWWALDVFDASYVCVKSLPKFVIVLHLMLVHNTAIGWLSN